VGNEGQSQYNRTLTFVSLTNQTDTVALYPAELYDNSTGKAISMNNTQIEPSTFKLTEAAETTVNIIIRNTKNVPGGTYQGTILGTASIYNSTTNKYQITLVKINVSLVIRPGLSLIYSPEIWAILGIVIAEFIAFLYPDEWRFKTIIVAFVGAAVIITWIFVLFYFGFTPTSSILTAIATIVIMPFGAWVIGYFNDKRTTGNDQIKSSRDIENDGNKSDIDLIRGVLGELATHAASFKPTISEKKPFPTIEVSDESKLEIPLDKRARIFYTENGKLSRKVWDGSCKQGAMSDLPVLSLQRYYGFVDIYNRYYSCALFITTDDKDKDKGKPEISKADAEFLKSFEAFRLQYAEVETVLFTYLSYLLGLIIKTNLKPLPMEFPRVNRVFLKKMIDYGLLDPNKYPGNFERSPERLEFWIYRREFLERYSPTEKRLQKEERERREQTKKKSLQDYMSEVAKEYGDRFSECELTEKFIRLRNLSEEFKRWSENPENTKAIEEQVKKEAEKAKKTEYKKELDIALREEYIQRFHQKGFDEWEETEYSRWIDKVKAKDKIDAWQMTETGLENISDVIYRNNSIPLFYRKVGEDFNDQFGKLETKMKDLKPLNDEFLKKEKKTRAVMDDATIKFLSDSIDGLKKLLNPSDANQPTTNPSKNGGDSKSKKKPSDKT
jgi:hypothetical protein